MPAAAALAPTASAGARRTRCAAPYTLTPSHPLLPSPRPSQSQVLEVKTCIRYAKPNGLKVDRAKTIAKLPPERQAWLQKELRRWPQLLDQNLDLLAKLADPECPGPNENTVRANGKWEPELAVAYDFSIDRMARGRWRWFHGSINTAERQDLSIDSLVELEGTVQ